MRVIIVFCSRSTIFLNGDDHVNHCNEIIRVTNFIRNLRGGSQSILALASDGLYYVVKFQENPQGANLLFNECIGTELYRACGLPVPSWKPLSVSDSFLDQNKSCWMQTPEGPIRPSSGLCFGSQFLGADGVAVLEILPGNSFKRVINPGSFWLAWLVDICAMHADNRQALFLQSGDGWLEVFFVDHGHLFGGPKGQQRPNFLVSRYLDPRIYQGGSSRYLFDTLERVTAIDVDRLWQKVKAVPEEWKTKSALEGFEKCLGRLTNADLLRNVADTIVETCQNRIGNSECTHNVEKGYSVMRAGVLVANFGRRLIGGDAGYLVCPS
jgi:hypothetical protein